MIINYNSLSQKTIGQVVTEHPELVKIFMQYEVDFCCGGDRSLEEAINRDTDEIEAIKKALTVTLADAFQVPLNGRSINLSSLSDAELIEKIVKTHHAYLRETLPEISELLFKLLNVHSENHPELFEVHRIFGGLKTELEGHLIKEEKQLFPALLARQVGLETLILTLESEHDGAGDALHKLTELTNHFKVPKDGCKTYELVYEKLKNLVADMYMHVHTENNILFKRVKGE
ncbi:iron-sulfur cluster repair di-iron protein [Fusibacter bizertensis]